MGEDFRYPNCQHLPTTGSQEPSLGTAKAYMFSPHSTCTWEASNFKRFISQCVSMVRGGNGSQALIYHNSTNAPFLMSGVRTILAKLPLQCLAKLTPPVCTKPPRGGRPWNRKIQPSGWSWLLNLSHPSYAGLFGSLKTRLWTSRIKDLEQFHTFTSWWLNQPIWKIFVKLDHFPKFRGENKKCLSCHHLDSALDTHCTPKKANLRYSCEELWKTFNGIYFETRRKTCPQTLRKKCHHSQIPFAVANKSNAKHGSSWPSFLILGKLIGNCISFIDFIEVRLLEDSRRSQAILPDDPKSPKSKW